MDRALRLDFGSFDRKYKSTHNETLSLCGRTQSHVHEEFEGLPSAEFLIKLDPLLAGLRDRLFRNTYTSDEAMGNISAEWAEKLGISTNVIIGVGAFDCHMGAVGAEIESYDFVRVMGTSTCDMLIAPTEEIGHLLIKGICGQVDGSIIPNMLGMEAGQSAYGEYYAWFQQIVVEQVRELLGEKAAEELSQKLIPYLSEKASLLPITENDPVAIDWINGRRTPDANHALKAAFMGLNLGTDAIKIFKMIVEATAFGSKAIVDRFIEEGVPIKQVIAIGGVAKKSPFKIVFKPVVKSTEEITAICKAANATQNCVGMHTFSSAKMWINGLNILQVPLLHLHSQFNRDFHTLILTWIL